MKEQRSNRSVRLNVYLNEWMKHEILGSNATETNEDYSTLISGAACCDKWPNKR